MGIFAKWFPGDGNVMIYNVRGGCVGSYSMPPIVCAACPGPRFFAFNCEGGVTAVIDTKTNAFSLI